MAVVHRLGFSKFIVCNSTSGIAMLFCFPVQNFTEIGQSAAELWPKKRFLKADRRHLEFLKSSYLVT